MGQLIAGDRVKHLALGWVGTVQTTGPDRLVAVHPDNGHGSRWFQADEFELVQNGSPAQVPAAERDYFRLPARVGGVREVQRPANALDVRDRYLRDPVFHHLVQMMLAAIQGGAYTPTEVREAAMLAQTIYEERNISRPIYIPADPRD